MLWRRSLTSKLRDWASEEERPMVPWWWRRKPCARLVAALVRSPGISISLSSAMCPSVKASLVLQLAVRLTSSRLRRHARASG